MATLTHLADTSVITRLDQPEVLAILKPLITAKALARTHLADLEYGAGARTRAEWQQRLDALGIMPLELINSIDFQRAIQVQGLLAAVGQRGRPLPDLLLAATSERLSLTLIHYDRDFDLIARITNQRTPWVVPKGSID